MFNILGDVLKHGKSSLTTKAKTDCVKINK